MSLQKLDVVATIMVIAETMTATPLNMLRKLSTLIRDRIGVDIRQMGYLPFASSARHLGELLTITPTETTLVFTVGYNRDIKCVWWEAARGKMVTDDLLYWGSRDPYFVVVATLSRIGQWQILIWDLRDYNYCDFARLRDEYQAQLNQDLEKAIANIKAGRNVRTQANGDRRTSAQKELTAGAGKVSQFAA